MFHLLVSPSLPLLPPSDKKRAIFKTHWTSSSSDEDSDAVACDTLAPETYGTTTEKGVIYIDGECDQGVSYILRLRPTLTLTPTSL